MRKKKRIPVVVIIAECSDCGQVWTIRMMLNELTQCPACGSLKFVASKLAQEE